MEYLLCMVAYGVAYRNNYSIMIASRGLKLLLHAGRLLYLK